MRRDQFIILAAVLMAGLGTAVYLQRLEQKYLRREQEQQHSHIDGNLYMGGIVKEPPLGTSAVVCLCPVRDAYEVEASDYAPIYDGPPAPSIDWLRKRVQFIDTQLRAGKITYVHCAQGVSRSGMVVAAYLMYRHGWTRDEAIEYMRTKRPMVNPNPAFRERLLDWQRELERDRRL